MRFSVSVATTALCLILLSGNGAVAQEDATEGPRCWFGSMTFSPGATVRASGVVMTCSTEMVWESSPNSAASGCIFDGEFFAEGAVIPDSANYEPKSVCHSDGTWKGLQE